MEAGRGELVNWQAVATRDPFLAGSIAARSHEWWMEETAEQHAASVELQGEQREKFLAGWAFELGEQERERKESQEREREEWLDELESQVVKYGDPVYWQKGRTNNAQTDR